MMPARRRRRAVARASRFRHRLRRYIGRIAATSFFIGSMISTLSGSRA
jgi:hypothetical protein